MAQQGNSPIGVDLILCDDVRQEARGQTSLIGIYGDVIGVAKLPHLFPKLCFHFRFQHARGKRDVKITLKGPDGKAAQLLSNPIDFKERGKFILTTHIAPFQVEKEGTYAIEVIIGQSQKHSFTFLIKKYEQKEKAGKLN